MSGSAVIFSPGFTVKNVSRYILVSSVMAILMLSLFGFYSLKQYQEKEYLQERQKLEMCIKTFWQLLLQKGTDIRTVDGTMYAGSYRINGNFELPDKVQEIFGGVATIFMADERVATNVLTSDGKRALGTKLVGPAYDAIYKQGKPYRGETTILGIPYLTAYDPIRDREGAIVGVLFVGVKSSELLDRQFLLKKQITLTLSGLIAVFVFVMLLLGRGVNRAEAAIRHQMRFHETLINAIPTPVFNLDSAGRYRGCNKAFQDFTGFANYLLIGKTPDELWPSEIADCYQRHNPELLQNPGGNVYESAVRHADGTLRSVLFKKATFVADDGTPEGIVGVMLDITALKAAEEASKNAVQQLSDIVEFLPDATFVIDRQKRVTAWNRAIEQLTGVRKQEIIGKGDYAYAIPFYNDNRPLLIDLLENEEERIRLNYRQISKEGQTLFTEVFVPAFRNGEGRYLWATASPLLDSEGHKVGAIESIRDITGYKQIEKERAQLESRLDHARMIEVFMTRLNHDLRTPLTPLYVLLPLMQNRITDPDLLKMLSICRESAGLIKKMMDRAQNLVKLSSRIGTQPFERISLVSPLESALESSAGFLADKSVTCSVDLDPSIMISGVPDQLKELFANLISNATRASSEGGVIRFSALQKGDMLTVAVHDDGIGLMPEHFERIFDELFKVDDSRHDLDAPGLGLSICKRIVMNHHGRIWAESPGIGKGATIFFTINEVDTDH